MGYYFDIIILDMAFFYMLKRKDQLNMQMQLIQKWNAEVVDNIPENFKKSKGVIEALNQTDPLTAYREILNLAKEIYFRKPREESYKTFFKSIYENKFLITLQEDQTEKGQAFKNQLQAALSKEKIGQEFKKATSNESGFGRFMSLFTGGLLSLKGILYPFVYIGAFIGTILSTASFKKAFNAASDAGRLVAYNPLTSGRIPFAQNCSLEGKTRVNFGHPLGTGFIKEEIHPAFKGYVESTGNNFFYIGNLKSPSGFTFSIEKRAERAREQKIREYMGDNYCQLPADNVFLFNGKNKKDVLEHQEYQYIQNFEEHLKDAFFKNPHKNDIYIPDGLKAKVVGDHPFSEERYHDVIEKLMKSSSELFFQKSLDKLTAQEQTEFKLFFFKAVLPNFLLEKSGCSSVGAACKDGIDRGNTTAVMMELFSKNYFFDSGMIKKKEPNSKVNVDILIQDSSLSAAIAKGRGVNEHRVILDMFVQKTKIFENNDLNKWNLFNQQFSHPAHHGNYIRQNSKIVPASSLEEGLEIPKTGKSEPSSLYANEYRAVPQNDHRSKIPR